MDHHAAVYAENGVRLSETATKDVSLSGTRSRMPEYLTSLAGKIASGLSRAQHGKDIGISSSNSYDDDEEYDEDDEKNTGEEEYTGCEGVGSERPQGPDEEGSEEKGSEEGFDDGSEEGSEEEGLAHEGSDKKDIRAGSESDDFNDEDCDKGSDDVGSYKEDLPEGSDRSSNDDDSSSVHVGTKRLRKHP